VSLRSTRCENGSKPCRCQDQSRSPQPRSRCRTVWAIFESGTSKVDSRASRPPLSSRDRLIAEVLGQRVLNVGGRNSVGSPGQFEAQLGMPVSRLDAFAC
jgi:hypothetical protein